MDLQKLIAVAQSREKEIAAIRAKCLSELASSEPTGPARVVAAVAPGSAIRVYHVEGHAQYEGSARFHLYADCRHLTRKRTWGPMDMTGATVEDTIDPSDRRICKHCRKRHGLLPNNSIGLTQK